jgi:hypothetical protein
MPACAHNAFSPRECRAGTPLRRFCHSSLRSCRRREWHARPGRWQVPAAHQNGIDQGIERPLDQIEPPVVALALGASLSNGFQITERFSEDIDIRIEPPPERGGIGNTPILHASKSFASTKELLSISGAITLRDRARGIPGRRDPTQRAA